MAISDIKHVVILMQENRSFDQYFGTFPNVNGFADPSFKVNGSARPCLPFRGSTFSSNAEEYGGDDHSWSGMHNAYHTGEGCLPVPAFYISPSTSQPTYAPGYNEEPVTATVNTYPGYAYYAANDIPYHWVLGSTFMLCDHWLASVLGPTASNRLYLMSGCMRSPSGPFDGSSTSDRATDTIGDPFNIDPTTGHNIFAHGVLTWDSYPVTLFKQKPAISWNLYDETGDGGIDPTYYAQTAPSNAASAPVGNPPFSPGTFVYPTNAINGWGTLNILNAFSNSLSSNNYSGSGNFVTDALNGGLPTISWLIQPFGASEWQGNHPSDGAQYIAQKLDAILGRNPDGTTISDNMTVWQSTVFIILYDENDGAFDHADPNPVTDPPTGMNQNGVPAPGIDGTVEAFVGGLAIGPGYRVPAIIISPWTVNPGKKPGWDVSGAPPSIQTQLCDHTAILELLHLVTGVPCTNIGPWRSWKFNSTAFWNNLFAAPPPQNLDAVRSMIPTQAEVRQYQLNTQARMLPYLQGGNTEPNRPFPSGPPSLGRNPIYLPVPSPNAPWPPVPQQFYFLELSQTSFGADDVQAVATSQGVAQASFPFGLVLDGFEPNELAGLVQALNAAPPAPLPRGLQPTLYVLVTMTNNPSAGPVAGVQITNVNITDSAGNPPPAVPQVISPAISQAQRWTINFDLVFTDPTIVFNLVVANGNNPVDLTLTAIFSSNLDWSAALGMQLVAKADPFMLTGSVQYLSRDLRVYEVFADSSLTNNPFGIAFDPSTTTANQYIQNVLAQLNAGDPALLSLLNFDADPAAGAQNPAAQAVAEAPFSQASVLPSINGKPVFSFAIARVTLQGWTDPAPNVQMLFRIFPAPSVGTFYDEATRYPMAPTPGGLLLPQPGFVGTDVLTIPCFATERGQISPTNPDLQNWRLSISPAVDAQGNPTGAPVYTYFGCLLDINSSTAQIAGPSGPILISSFAKSAHQCVVAEIVMGGQALAQGGDVPGIDTDKVVQRNLAVAGGTS